MEAWSSGEGGAYLQGGASSGQGRGWAGPREIGGSTFSSFDPPLLPPLSSPPFQIPPSPFFPQPDLISSRSGARVVSGWRAPAGSCSVRRASRASRRFVGRAAPVPPDCRGPPAGARGGRRREPPTPAAWPPRASTVAPAALRRSHPSSAARARRAGPDRGARLQRRRPRPRRSLCVRAPPARPRAGTSAATASATARAAAGTAATAR